jgi:hypothetical protein
MSTVRINPLTGFPEVMPDTRGGGIMIGLGSPFASSIREAALVGNRERVDPYKGTRFEGFTGLGNDGYGSLSQGPMDNVLSDGFFVNDPRRPRPGMRGSSDSGIPAIPTKADFYAFKNTLRDPGDMGRYVAPGEEMSYEDFVKFGRPANLAAAEAAGYGGGALLGNKALLGNRPPNPNNSLIDPGFSPNLMGAGRLPVEIDPGFSGPPDFRQPRPVEIIPNYRPNLPYRPNPNLPFNGNPNMYQRPMPRPFGFGGRPMNPFMGMGLGGMNPMGMGMFGGFPMRPPMFGGYGGYGGGYGGGYNMMRPPMGFGLGGANPYGMNPYSNFGRPNPYPQPSYNRPNPYSSGMSFNQPNFMQQQQGGYGSYQQPSGYGNYGGMQNPYQPQQMGNTNNFAGYGQQQAMF